MQFLPFEEIFSKESKIFACGAESKWYLAYLSLGLRENKSSILLGGSGEDAVEAGRHTQTLPYFALITEIWHPYFIFVSWGMKKLQNR